MAKNKYLINLGIFFGSVILSLLVAMIGLALSGIPAVSTFRIMLQGSLGTVNGIAGSLVFAAPIALCAFTATVAFKMGLLNVGGGGQLIVGAIGASYVALHWGFLPGPLLLITVILAGAVMGALYAMIPAVLKLWLRVDVMLSSLMLNYVAILMVDYLVTNLWRDPALKGWPFSRQFPDWAMLPSIGRSGVHLGLVFAVVAGVILYFVLKDSSWGFQLSVIGNSPRAADYSGMNVKGNTLLTLAVSGMLAGLAGVGEVAGLAGRLSHMEPTYGYTGILVAWLSSLNPLLVLPISWFYGLLLQAVGALKIIQVHPSLVLMIQASIVLFTTAGMAIANRPWRLGTKTSGLPFWSKMSEVRKENASE